MQSNDGDMCVGAREKIQGDTRYLPGDVSDSPKSVRYWHLVTVKLHSTGCADVRGHRQCNDGCYEGQQKISFIEKPDRNRPRDI